MKSKFNILLIAILVVIGSSCSKFEPLEKAGEKEDAIMLKAGSSGIEDSNSNSGITDPDHDEDYDSDGNITDTDNEEDHDKEISKG